MLGFKLEQHVLVKHYAPDKTKSEKDTLNEKVKVKVTRSFILASFEKASIVEFAYQI